MNGRKANPAGGVFFFGMNAITGLQDTWLLETHDSFAALESYDDQYGGFSNTSDRLRVVVAFYRQWWSHRPEEAMQMLPRSRYMQISLYRTGLGSEAEFANLLRARRASLDSINLDRPDLVYQVLSGDYSGTYLVLSPLQSLKALDDGVSRSAAAYLRSTGSPGARGTQGVAAQAEINHQNLLFRIVPGLSSVSEQFAEPNPQFWKQR